MRRRWSCLCLAVVFTAGCAVPGPPLTPVTDPSQRLAFTGFSILPPRGSGWYISVREFGGIFFGKPATKPANPAHTFAASAMLVYPVGSAADLRAYAESQARGEGRFAPKTR